MTSAEKRSLRTVDLAYIALFAVLIAVCAWISVPTAVPFTLQTFGIFAALGLLGGRRGTYAVAVYLLLGAVGLPVFSGFRGGIGILLSTTGGYLVGFLAMALLYWFLTARLGDRLWSMLIAMLAGLLVCDLLGSVWYGLVYAGSIGWKAILWTCVLPFLPLDLAKLAAAALLSRRLKKYLS